MIEFLSSWTKGIGVTIVVVSILEMLLPDNKTKKYIRMVLGVFVIFNIVSPLIQNKEKFDLNNLDIEKYATVQTTSSASSTEQISMDGRAHNLYEKELEKDITKKLEEKGYKVISAQISTSKNKDQELEIKQIQLNIEKNQEPVNDTNETVENKIVTEVQKIKKIDTKIKKEEEKQETKTTNADIQNVKKFLIEEYGVKEKCLKIN